MEIPKKIGISGIDYKIKFVKDNSDDMHESQYRGKVYFSEDRIEILDSYTDNSKFRTLLHEIIHILDDNYKLELSEEIIARLGSGLYQVLKDNNLLR